VTVGDEPAKDSVRTGSDIERPQPEVCDASQGLVASTMGDKGSDLEPILPDKGREGKDLV
jgi:hypothetical protein